MLYMGCDEYRELVLLYEYAKRRVWRYTHPELDPFMSALGVVPTTERVENARADELELSWRVHAHHQCCEACRAQSSSAVAS